MCGSRQRRSARCREGDGLAAIGFPPNFVECDAGKRENPFPGHVGADRCIAERSDVDNSDGNPARLQHASDVVSFRPLCVKGREEVDGRHLARAASRELQYIPTVS
jgi:hypothetical protein